MNNKVLGTVYTKYIVADYMVSLFTLKKECSILDPCFGKGVFINALLKRGYHNISGCEFDINSFNFTKKIFGSYVKLFKGDFLFFDDNVKFDGIIMNPPYIRQEKIDSDSSKKSKTLLLKQNIYRGLSSKSNYYMYFIIKALNLLRSGGELIIICPNNWIKSVTGKTFLNNVEKLGKIVKIISVYGEPFELNVLVDVDIFVIKKTNQTEECVYKNLYIYQDTVQETDKGLCRYINPFSISFLNYAECRRGLTTGMNSMFINPSIPEDRLNRMPDIISSPKNIKGYNTKNSHRDKLFIFNENDKVSTDYVDYMGKKILENKKPMSIYKKILKDPYTMEWSKLELLQPGSIIFSYIIRHNIKFIFNDCNYQVRDNFYIIYPIIDKYLLFSLLNNYFIYVQLEKLGKRYGNGLLKIQLYDLKKLKLPNIESLSTADKNELIALGHSLANGTDDSKKTIFNISSKIAECLSFDLNNVIKEYKKMISDRMEK